ncbi:hypothetical protein EZS27_029779 [termite gut metagenome]|uniref:Peptidase S1 domain-containing protein n=1 Tax=termite gut metagenome TaxID=433724 RepID=A0A5J4QHY7_9ZZZZ
MVEKNLEHKSIPLCEILVKTTYQTQITHPTDKACEKPISYGCGFIVKYKKMLFFITADHTVHFDDYNNETKKSERTGTDYVISIFNNVRPENDTISTVVTPLGGFYYMERFNILKPDDALELIDVSLCIMKPINFQYPFLTDQVHFGSFTVNAGESKLSIQEELFVEPKTDVNYFVYGKIKYQMKGISLYREDTLKEGLKYISKSGDYYLLNTPQIINDYEDWAGLSGSPVLNENGECIGVLCIVNKETNSIWVMSINKVKMLMDIALVQEQLNVKG